MRGDLCRPQGAMTCRGGFQTRPCGVHHASKSNAADDEKGTQVCKGSGMPWMSPNHDYHWEVLP